VGLVLDVYNPNAIENACDDPFSGCRILIDVVSDQYCLKDWFHSACDS
jgi:hypothetical protein